MEERKLPQIPIKRKKSVMNFAIPQLELDASAQAI